MGTIKVVCLLNFLGWQSKITSDHFSHTLLLSSSRENYPDQALWRFCMKTQAQLFKDYSCSQPPETPVCIVSLKELLIRKMAQSENQVCPAYVTPPPTSCLAYTPECHTNKSFVTLCIQALWSKTPSPIGLDSKRPGSALHSARGTVHGLSSHSSLISP